MQHKPLTGVQSQMQRHGDQQKISLLGHRDQYPAVAITIGFYPIKTSRLVPCIEHSYTHFMIFLRALLIWGLALSLPVEGMAANMMTHCKDMQRIVVGKTAEGITQHDHAAMMANMSDDASMANMHHHSMQSDSAKKSGKASQLGCQCGCKCGGDCALSCTGMMMSFTQSDLPLYEQASSPLASLQRSQARAAYRYDPLRPPSAVAL